MITFRYQGDRYDLDFDQSASSARYHTATISKWELYDEDDASDLSQIDMPRSAAVALATSLLRKFAPERLISELRIKPAVAKPVVVDFPARQLATTSA